MIIHFFLFQDYKITSIALKLLAVSILFFFSCIIQMKQNSSEKILSPVDDQDISNFTISGMDLLAIYDFTVKAELRMIFDLNVLLRNPDGSWNDSNAQEIIAFAKNQGMTLDWQLGNGKQLYKRKKSIYVKSD